MTVFELAGPVCLACGEMAAKWQGVCDCVDLRCRWTSWGEENKRGLMRQGVCCFEQAGVEDGDSGSRYVDGTTGKGLDEVVILSSALHANRFESSDSRTKRASDWCEATPSIVLKRSACPTSLRGGRSKGSRNQNQCRVRIPLTPRRALAPGGAPDSQF